MTPSASLPKDVPPDSVSDPVSDPMAKGEYTAAWGGKRRTFFTRLQPSFITLPT